MLDTIEARYLYIRWSDAKNVLKVEKAYLAAEVRNIESLDANALQSDDYSDCIGFIETHTYRKYFPRIGVTITSGKLKHIPYFLSANGEKHELLSVKDPLASDVWWIENSGWDKKKKRYHTELFRTVGTLTLVIQDSKILIQNNCLDFTTTELEQYLTDFKTDLWFLILNRDNYIQATIERDRPSIINDQLLSTIDRLTGAVEKILANPKVELREIQEPRPIRLVRPIPKTFVEIAAKGWSKQLASRSFENSYDTVDNQYIHFVVFRTLHLARQLLASTLVQHQIHLRKIETERARIANLSSPNKQINSKVFDGETSLLQSQLDEIVSGLNSHEFDKNSAADEEWICRFKLGLTYRKEPNQYFCKELKGRPAKSKKIHYVIIGFPDEFSPKELGLTKGGIEIEVSGLIRYGNELSKKGKLFRRINFTKVFSCSLVSHPIISKLEGRPKRRADLEMKGWEKPYDRREQKDIEQEKETAKQKMGLSLDQCELFRGAQRSLEPIVQRLKTCSEFFNSNKIKQRAVCPNTMSFVQNPNYSLAKSSFAKVLKNNGLSSSVFNSLLEIEAFGLVNISSLYERWCLIQIIKILADNYRFTLTENWQNDLVRAVENNEHNIKFELTSEEMDRKILLTYEMVLPSGKRPDFVLDLTANNEEGQEVQSRLVIDAKFRDNLTDETLSDLVHQMYRGKNYSEGGKNRVFILHPSSRAISNPTSPLAWGENSDYGQLDRHMYGGVYLSPSIKNGNNIDNLQRLIGMFLQQSTYFKVKDQSGSDNYGQDHEPGSGVIDHNAFCFNCGNADKGSLSIKENLTKGGGQKFMANCGLCASFNVYSFCWSCKEKLYKNEEHWTFHKTLAESPFNIMCSGPDCHKYFDPDIS